MIRKSENEKWTKKHQGSNTQGTYFELNFDRPRRPENEVLWLGWPSAKGGRTPKRGNTLVNLEEISVSWYRRTSNLRGLD